MNAGNLFLYDLVLKNNEWQDGFQVLEIGFGNGKFFPELFTKARNVHVSGLDFSSEMVAAARKENRDWIIAGRLHIQEGESNRMPFADASFDFVFCINVIYFWESPEEHLAEIKRVLKPDGIFCTGMRPKSSMEKLPFTQFGFHMYTEDEWQAILIKNGFSISKSIRADEPPFELYDQQLNIESLCINATKS